MAATSHDFGLENLSPPVWKYMHMFVYLAYGLLVLHIGFGALQSELSVVYPILLGVGIVLVSGLHILAGTKESARDAQDADPAEGWIDVGPADDIPEDRARVVCVQGDERVAVFRYDGKVSAVSNVCEHQMGPLGEGKIVDGCITCPWHGYQYRPADGCSPPPYTEKIATYEVRIEGGRVKLNPRAKPKGTLVEPAVIPSVAEDRDG